jgi:uncharacterized protein
VPDEESVARTILERHHTWAVVGCSPDPGRASHRVARFLQDHGYRFVPVNPLAGCDEVLGERCYPDLASAAATEDIEVVDVFRRSEHAGGHVDEAIAIGARAVWFQLGVIDHAAAARARGAGLEMVMDRCPAIDHPRFFGRAQATRSSRPA